MKRVLAALFGTTAGLVALLNFKTHPATSAAPAAAATAAAPPAAAGSTPTTDPSSSTAGTVGTTGGGTGGSTSSSTSGSTSGSTGSASSGTRTVTGDSADTRWGPVQVRITVSNGRITKADAVVYPTENPRDQEINSYAVPALNQEAVSASSARIDTISGATYTSDGYIQSLQSALDKAGL